MNCVICGEKLKHGNQLTAALWHFRPLDWGQRKWLFGTWRTFGLRGAITLISPAINTLVNWKYRKARLTSQFCALDDLDNKERELAGMEKAAQILEKSRANVKCCVVTIRTAIDAERNTERNAKSE